MKTFTITQEQVAQLIKSAKDESSQLIIADLKNWFPEADKSETDKWYVVRHNSPNMQDAFVFLQEESVQYTFGFNHHGEWTDIYNNENLHKQYFGDIVRLATDQEIKALLIAEAQKRNIWNVPMVRINGATALSQHFGEAYDSKNDELWSTYGSVYNAGKWATPLRTTRDKVMEQVRLMDEIRRLAKINIVTCGSCGDVVLHKAMSLDSNENIVCPYCDHESEPSDFPDFLYNGIEDNYETKNK